MFDVVPFPENLSWSPTSGSSIKRLSWTMTGSPVAEPLSSNQDIPKLDLEDGMNLDYASIKDTTNSVDGTPTGISLQKSTSAPDQSLSEQHDVLSRRPRPRKGHKKSRFGCFNCKRRKIKCPENTPSCHNCIKVKLSCEYPIEQKPIAQVTTPLEEPITSLSTSPNLQSTPTIFRASDMRLFHHFLTTAYPHLPLGNETAWVKDIPSFAHSYDYLLQAILGLAASHLNMTSSSSFHEVALSYRILSIRNLNAALSKTPTCAAEADALLATCYALSFQTSYLGSSVEEFLTMLRGCMLVMKQNWYTKYGTSFSRISHEGQMELIEHRLKDLPVICADMVGEAKESLGKMGHLCEGTINREVYQLLNEIVELLYTSSHDAYLKNRELHLYFSNMPHTSFQHFISPTNAVAQLLLAHFISIHVLMAPIKAYEWAARTMAPVSRTTWFFIKPIVEKVPVEMRGYLDWPMRASGVVKGVPSVLQRLCGRKWVVGVDELGKGVVPAEFTPRVRSPGLGLMYG